MNDIKLPELQEKLNYLLDNLEHEVMKDRLDRMASVPLDIEDFVRDYALASIKEQSLQGVSDFGQLQSALEDIDRLKAKLSAVRENQRWQPIETAPMDKAVLVLLGDGRILSARKKNMLEFSGDVCGIRYGEGWNFTHWMPLPSVPDSEGVK